MSLKVNEIFYSIQGESSYAGLPCVFVRLTGCNLRCTYCDTRYAFYEGSSMDMDRVISIVGSYRCRLVEITGGEPLIQEETPGLISCLIDDGYTVLMETNGSMDIGVIHEDCIKIVDVKCPSSGQVHENDMANLYRLGMKDEVKFVIGDRTDYEYAREVVKEHHLTGRNMVFFSPVFGRMDPALLARWILDDRMEVRLHIQLHRVIWPREDRGV